MRLTQIKLAGFKSFVDPTTIAVPGQLVGIVGPNGCGKSNVIDAVRWVLGESSAKHLRGDKMDDVIFNGSSQRKPVSRASVELVFDNSLGRIGGPWAQYNEIAVKRVIQRDGDSNYYINGQHVRRRDITDMFLGTGLGPRAYAIIEQGMISRVITSKPEELRVFLEEVAGVSKYRERRRETQNRLEDTRENLSRVEDIRIELGNQLEKLAQQAEVAAKYHELHKELGTTQNLLAFTRQREASQAKARYANEIVKLETGIEAETAKLREAEAELEKLRQDHYAESDALHDIQAKVYEANSEVNQIEQEITFLGESRRRLTAQMTALAQQLAEVEMSRETTTAEESRWKEELEGAAEKIELANIRVEESRNSVPDFEEKVRAAIAETKSAENTVREAEATLSLDEARESHALKILSQLEQRKNRLTVENLNLVMPDAEHLAGLEAERAELAERLAQAEERLAALDEEVPSLEQSRRDAVNGVQDASRELAKVEAALLALQNQQARLDNNNKVAMWLSKHNLENAPRLWQAIKIEQGWEDALESALGVRLNAIRISDRNALPRLAEDSPPGSVAVLVDDASSPAGNSGANGLKPLWTLVTASHPGVMPFVRECLANVMLLEDETQAASRTASLPEGALLVTKNGHLYSRHGLVFHGPQSELHGVLQRQREIEDLQQKMPVLVEARNERDGALRSLEQRLNELQDEARALRGHAAEAKTREHAIAMEAQKLSQAMAQAEARRAAIKAELAEIEQEEVGEREAMQDAQRKLQEGADRVNELMDQLIGLEEKQKQSEAALQDARNAVVTAERGVQEANFFQKSCTEKIASLATFAQSLISRAQSLAGSKDAITAELDQMHEGNLRERLQSALSVRSEREAELTKARDALDGATGRLKTLDETKATIEHSLQPMRDKINEIRLKEQEASIHEQQFRLQLEEAGANPEELAELIEKRTRSSSMQAEINRLQEEIAALGPVNLAALQELQQGQERKDFLDKQSADLTEAVETLEAAIKRIDRETRELLQTTFDQVNKNFSEMFPSLFGGGNAYLKLTGEEILDAGLQVFAQPPGKKNQSIQLLSGGEKALTALSLVFSLFRLNPAPFCLLDEVDAPLDDSNTVRYCDLVKKMSDSTQFLFITHNKVTMEMGQQLVGVTMNEPGVSRVVEVDIDAAMKFAGSTAQAAAA
ncbi:MAG: chromosome segregation protein SMC [Betaproteobacteria bacterium]|nr:chromosome segregation protein SMC [Betaproteobacteria bacterium]